MDIKVRDILKICDGELLSGSEDVICEDFSNDTRTLHDGDVYVGIKGERFDGNTLFEQAFENGAKVCIIQDVEITLEIKDKYKDRCIIKVKDTINALQRIASYKRSLYNIPVIAITGSVGKTSTKDIVASVVGTSFNVLKTQGNYNNHIGLPLTILKLKDHEALVVEMGMNNLGEISVLSKIAKPNIAIITNVGTAHIGNLGSRENILKAKLEILDGLADGGTLIINNDNDLIHEWFEKHIDNKNVFTYGIYNESNIMARNIKLNDNSSTFDIRINQKELPLNITVPVIGEHFIYNALCAISVGELLKIDFAKIKDGIEKFELTKNRMEIIKNNGITIINDCYNANFDSMKAGIESLSQIAKNRKIAVLGDMLELGEFSKELHSKVGKEVAKNKIDILITIGNEAKNIADTVTLEGMNKENVFSFDSNTDAIGYIKSILKSGDTLLIKASNAMKFVEIVEALK